MANPVVWLILGGLSGVFVSGRWNLAFAAWLVPVFLLHYAHAVPLAPALLGIWAVTALATGLSHWRVVPVPWFLYPLVIAAIGAPLVLPYLADRLLAPPLPGPVSTLVFPLAWVSVEYLGARFNPFGTWGALAYTQYRNLPLVQLAAVAGLWGVAFVVTWFASVGQWVWQGGHAGAELAAGVSISGTILGVVLVAGRLRLNRASDAAHSVRVATVGWPDGVLEIEQMMRVFAPDLTAQERESLRAAFARIEAHFAGKTAEAARAGAKLVVWPEANIMAFPEAQAALTARLQALARTHGIYLLAGIARLDPAAPRPFENTAVLFDPDGAIVARYTKTTAVPGLEARYAVRGDGRLPVASTGPGRLAIAICYDLDFPRLLRQAGQGRADLLLVPASDWREIGELHHAAAVFRAVENGVALVRATRWGWSAVVDACGRELARLDHFAASERVLIAEAPVAGRRTLYARFGDAFAWLCIVGLAALMLWAMVGAPPQA